MEAISPESVLALICSNPNCPLIEESRNRVAPCAWHIVEHLIKGDDGYTCPFEHENGPYTTRLKQTVNVHVRCQHTYEMSHCPEDGCDFKNTDPARITKHLKRDHGTRTSRRNNPLRYNRPRPATASATPPAPAPLLGYGNSDAFLSGGYPHLLPSAGEPSTSNQEHIGTPPAIPPSHFPPPPDSPPLLEPAHDGSIFDGRYPGLVVNPPREPEVVDPVTATMRATFGSLSFWAACDLGLVEELYGGLDPNYRPDE